MRLTREKGFKTNIEGLSQSKSELKKILKVLKKEVCHSNGNITDGEIIMQGDFRTEIKEYLIKNLGIKPESIEVHGI